MMTRAYAAVLRTWSPVHWSRLSTMSASTMIRPFCSLLICSFWCCIWAMYSTMSPVVLTTALYRFSISSPVSMFSPLICSRATARAEALSKANWSVVMDMLLMGSITLYSASHMAAVSISTKKPKNSDSTRARNW